MSHRNRLLLALLATVALLAFMAAPALAHHKEGHDGGNAETSETESTEEASAESDERSRSSRTSGDGSTQEASTTEEDSSTQRSTSQRADEPDPEPSQAPPATKGPSCEDYSGEEGGPYDHDNCDESQGQHGSGGNDKCAGCTGKADDKSPGGQRPGDHNNGYECDNNGGVGKGNPPHARCPVNPPPQELCPVGSDLAGMPPGKHGCNLPPKELCPPGTDREGLPPNKNGCNDKVRGRIDLVCPAGTDRAGKKMDDLEDCDDNVLGGRITNPVTPPLGKVTRQEPAAVLPRTGGTGAMPMAILGMLLILLGALSMKVQKQS